jgi:glycerate 2-kinase
MHILIAPNAFKNCLSATAAAEAIQEGFTKSNLQFTSECFPVGDGGDGTGELIIKHLNGSVVSSEVHDPLGRKIKSSFGLIEEGKTAVIEMADASGLRLLSAGELSPLTATTYGAGELIKHALDSGVKKVIIGIGGSATVDGGCGILNALGIRFLNLDGEELSVSPKNLLNLGGIDTTGLDKRIFDCEIIILCDVDNKLTGKDGAAAVFGPQKGASKDDMEILDQVLSKFASVAFQKTGKDLLSVTSGGAAGGTAAGLFGFLNAKLVNGIDYFLQLTGFDKALNKCNLLITGEGSIDEQTLNGKGPFGVARRAKLNGITVIGLAGKVPLETNQNMQQYFDVLLSIGHEPGDLGSAISRSRENLVRTAKQIGNLLAINCDIKPYSKSV